MEGKIEHSKTNGYYTLTVNGKFYGNYDTFKEASDEYSELCVKDKEEKKTA